MVMKILDIIRALFASGDDDYIDYYHNHDDIIEYEDLGEIIEDEY